MYKLEKLGLKVDAIEAAGDSACSKRFRRSCPSRTALLRYFDVSTWSRTSNCRPSWQSLRNPQIGTYDASVANSDERGFLKGREPLILSYNLCSLGPPVCDDGEQNETAFLPRAMKYCDSLCLSLSSEALS